MVAIAGRFRVGAFLYWTLAVLLIAFGFIDLVAIGAPFLLVGLALAALWPVRRSRRVYWSAMAGAFGFIAGFVLAAPLGCTSSSSAYPVVPGITSPPAVGHTICTNILGLDYSGTTPYSPSYLPALIVGLVAGGVVGAAAWLVSGRIGRRAPAR